MYEVVEEDVVKSVVLRSLFSVELAAARVQYCRIARDTRDRADSSFSRTTTGDVVFSTQLPLCSH